ncbi:hypothetical protein [Glycomyces paridis]|uniref:hypothetical protein n=1 Tax=Glycomyces paridis TaxID=2126555 RepID=UPI001305331B|nr:hypothetical protein [Glycomyces paridis]
MHGLEDLAADELAELGTRVRSVRKRQVLIAAPTLTGVPRTVDDLLVQVAETADPGPTKPDLARLWPLLDAADLAPVAADFASGEPVLTVSASIGASIGGRRTYNRHDLEAVVGAFLAERLGARFATRSGGARPPLGAAEWRAVLGPEGLLLGYRGRRPPLHRRPWKTASIPGTLHPPVAAAMARLAGIEAGMTVLDPCCGAGTILVEAAELAPGAYVSGSDLDPAAIAAAAVNISEFSGAAASAIGNPATPVAAGSTPESIPASMVGELAAPAGAAGGTSGHTGAFASMAGDPAGLDAHAAGDTGHRRIALATADAARLPVPTGSVDRIVTNPAWGRQVAERRGFGALLAEWRRIIARDGRLVCLIPQELLGHFDTGRWKLAETRTLSLSGRHPVVVVAEPRFRPGA